MEKKLNMENRMSLEREAMKIKSLLDELEASIISHYGTHGIRHRDYSLANTDDVIPAKIEAVTNHLSVSRQRIDTLHSTLMKATLRICKIPD